MAKVIYNRYASLRRRILRDRSPEERYDPFFFERDHGESFGKDRQEKDSAWITLLCMALAALVLLFYFYGYEWPLIIAAIVYVLVVVIGLSWLAGDLDDAA